DVRFFSSLDRESNAARRRGSGIDPRSVDNYLLNVDNPLVVPVDTKVRLLITAADVLHAWWVPEFAVKKDAIPGYINESWFVATQTGTFRGQCGAVRAGSRLYAARRVGRVTREITEVGL